MKYMNKLLQADEKAEDPAAAASTSDDKNYFYMQTEWLEQQIKLLVLDTKTNKCFRGEISNDIMQEVAEQLDLEYNGFMEECKRALTTNIGLPGFTYKIDYEELVFQAFKNDKFETQYLDIPLKVVKNQYELLDIAIETLAEATTMNSNVQTASTASGNSLRGFDPTKFQQDFDKLKELIDNNKQMEVKLIKKFAFLLKQKDDEMERLVKANKELKAKAKKMQGVGGSSAAAAAASRNADDDDQAYMDATQPMTPPPTNVDLIHQRTNTRGKRRQVLDSDSDTD